jgi:hypothetical protein
MNKWIGVVLMWGLFNGNTAAWAFRFSSPADGAVVAAGSTLLLELDSEGTDQLMGVLFTASLGVLKEKLDPFPPWRWSVKIPPHYVGAITFTATGRVFGQKTGHAPHAEVRVNVILPRQPIAIPPLKRPFSSGSHDRDPLSF